MKRTMLSLVSAALLAGASTVALAQSGNTGMTPGNPQQGTGTKPGGYNNPGTMGGGGGGTHMGMSSDRVKQVQSALEQNGQHVTVDGQWGRQTANALRNFQKQNGLNPTGQLDPETAQKLGLPQSG